VTTELLPVSTALTLGFLHALEVDHMIAVTTFVAGRPALGRAAGFGFRWGVGHSVAVLAAGTVLLLTGLRWPPAYDTLGEGLVGVMLVGLGVWAIRSSGKLHLHPPDQHGGHGHLHGHGEAAAAQHEDHRPAHAHAGTAGGYPHAHQHHHGDQGRGITLVGMFHGLAGTSAAVALVPVTLVGRLDLGLAYLVFFGIGVTAGMMTYAVVAAAGIRQAAARSITWARRLGRLIGVAGVGVGLWWVGQAWRG
jgi:hypothetical protein